MVADEVTTMSSIGITNALGNLSRASQIASTAKAAPEIRTATYAETGTTLKPDSVRLSMAGQAKLLHQQGTSPALIASSLGIKVADVDGYLGIKVAATPAPSEASTTSASTSQPVAQTEAPEATVPSSPRPQPAATEAPTAKS